MFRNSMKKILLSATTFVAVISLVLTGCGDDKHATESRRKRSAAMLSGRAAPCSTQLAQEHAAEKRSCGRPRPGWVGPRWETKKDGQPEN